MPRRKDIYRSSPTRQRLYSALCASLVLCALPVAFSNDAASFLSVAHAQQPDRATQALFLAVDRNDLPGVQAAIDGGADLEARELNGMQAVDLAIERGYFDIAHYLISVRNIREAQGGTATPTPSPAQLAQAKQEKLAQQPAERPVTPPAPELAPGSPNPFDAPQTTQGLPVIGEVREPSPADAAPTPTPASTPASTPAPLTATAQAPDPAAKSSAAKAFVTTFMDFFKPPNTSGIVRRETQEAPTNKDVLTAEELKQQIKQIEADIGDAPIKGPAVPISPEELASELPPAPQLPAGIATLNGVSLPTSELPPYRVSPTGAPTNITAGQQPEIASGDAFGDLQVSEITPDDTQSLAGGTPAPQQSPATSAPAASGALQDVTDSNLPFGGGVDPDILYLVGMAPKGSPAPTEAKDAEAKDADAKPTEVAAADPFAQPADPFAKPADPFAQPADPFSPAPKQAPNSVANILDTIDNPQEVKQLETHKPKLPDDAPDGGTPSDPFATSTAPPDPFAAPATTAAAPDTPPAGEVDELAGLLEGAGEKVTSQDGWDVKKVEGANLPGEMPVLADATPTGTILDGISLTLGADTAVGQAVGDDRLKMMAEDTIHKPCLQKGGPETVFCVDKVSWPFELEEDFQVDTIMYQGTRAIARYDAGRATYFHALFKGESFTKVVNYTIGRFGPPSELVQRAIAPLAQPRRDNPTYIWRSREPGTDTITTLEVRQFDDARGGFPDTNRGVVLLYRDHTGSIFPLLSQLELMVLKDSGALDLAPKTPDSVW